MSVIYLPPGVDREWLAPLTEIEKHRGEWVPSYTVDGEFRRLITRQSPAMFALVYLSSQLRSRQTGDRTSLARLHLEIAHRARAWKRPGPVRHAVLGPRKGAKTTWGGICATWALAHEWRDVALVLSDSTEQIRLLMGAVRTPLAENAWLQADYPYLQPWAGAKGRQDTAFTYVSRGGRTFAGRSIRQRTLGFKVNDLLPDLLILDDPEPEGANYTATAQTRLLDLLQHKIWPMNEQAAVLWLGTTTRYDSLAHQLARAARGQAIADWIADERFAPYVESALWRDQDGQVHSFWPERYSVEYLTSIKHTTNYRLNFALDPARPGGRHWTRSTFRYTTERAEELTLFIDPATTVTESADFTAFVVAGRVGDGVVIEYARAWRLRSTEIRQRAAMICQLNPRITRCAIEANKADDWAMDVLEPVDLRTQHRVPIAAGIRAGTYRVAGSKKGRIAKLLAEYERPRVWHAEGLPELEDQAQDYPDVDHDDLLDVTAALVAELLST